MNSTTIDRGAYVVRLGSWYIQRALAEPIRRQVFCVEQKVPETEEWDAWDVRSVHAIAFDAQGTAVGTGRLKPDRMIGRMAVQKGHRQVGVGGLILQALLEEARRKGFFEISLNAQTVVQGFYGHYGFVAVGPEFLESGIKHVLMKKSLR